MWRVIFFEKWATLHVILITLLLSFLVTLTETSESQHKMLEQVRRSDEKTSQWFFTVNLHVLCRGKTSEPSEFDS